MSLGGASAWVVWMIVGVVLSVAEIVIPSFFIIWFGVAAFVVGLLLLTVSMPLLLQILLWLLLSLTFFALFQLYYTRRQKGSPVGTSTGEVLGQLGTLTAAASPSERGKVKFPRPILGADEWPCLAEDFIPEGGRVEVTAIEGQLLRVRQCDNHNSQFPETTRKG